MGFLDRFKTATPSNAARAFQREMAAMCHELLSLYLSREGISFEQLPELDRQVLIVYMFGLVAAVNVEEQRGLNPQEMGEVEINVIQETFKQSKRMAMVCAHDIVEQTKTRNPANPIYGIVCRGQEILPTWRNGRVARVVQDMEEMVQMMRDIQNNVPVTPATPREELPEFRYHPNLYKGQDVTFQQGVCQCCGKTVDAYVEKLYCDADIHCICMDCVKSGAAVEKFGGEFSRNVDELVTDTERTDELLHRTPGYASWQGENWLTCCDDYCAYLGKVGSEELEALGIAEQVCREYESRADCVSDNVRDLLSVEGPITGYLFQCLHCGGYHLWVDVQEA